MLQSATSEASNGGEGEVWQNCHTNVLTFCQCCRSSKMRNTEHHCAHTTSQICDLGSQIYNPADNIKVIQTEESFQSKSVNTHRHFYFKGFMRVDSRHSLQ
jgi:hypothetical protein